MLKFLEMPEMLDEAISFHRSVFISPFFRILASNFVVKDVLSIKNPLKMHKGRLINKNPYIKQEMNKPSCVKIVAVSFSVYEFSLFLRR